MKTPVAQLFTSVTGRWRELRRRGGEDGSGGGISVTLLIAALALFLVTGLIVDGGAKARALDQAGALASEAARAAAQTVTPNADAAPDPVAAQRAVDAYLAASGAAGTVAVTGGQVRVHVTLTQPTAFLALIGISSFTVTGTGTAQIAYTPGSPP